MKRVVKKTIMATMFILSVLFAVIWTAVFVFELLGNSTLPNNLGTIGTGIFMVMHYCGCVYFGLNIDKD